MSRVWTIVGSGAHARKAYHCVTQAGDRVAAFVDEKPGAQAPVPGVPVWADSALETAAPAELFVAIGRAEPRQRLMDRAAAAGWRLPPLVHPRACVAPDAQLGEGVMVAAGAVVESGARLGRGAIVDIGALVDHDAQVQPFAHLPAGQVCGPGARWPA
jgi:UDP-perosamine 4-acetyltransferase